MCLPFSNARVCPLSLKVPAGRVDGPLEDESYKLPRDGGKLCKEQPGQIVTRLSTPHYKDETGSQTATAKAIDVSEHNHHRPATPAVLARGFVRLADGYRRDDRGHANNNAQPGQDPLKGAG
jgi:hypothetical protein